MTSSSYTHEKLLVSAFSSEIGEVQINLDGKFSFHLLMSLAVPTICLGFVLDVFFFLSFFFLFFFLFG